MNPTDERPPLLGTWNRLYAVVLGTLAAVVALFSVVSYVYR